MPYKDPEKEKEFKRQWQEKNKEKEKARKQSPEYKAIRKAYNDSPRGIQLRIISVWKRRGVINHDFDELYEKYINTELCQLCNVELTTGKRTKTTKCLDHDHETGLFRNIVCHSCNVKRG